MLLLLLLVAVLWKCEGTGVNWSGGLLGQRQYKCGRLTVIDTGFTIEHHFKVERRLNRPRTYRDTAVQTDNADVGGRGDLGGCVLYTSTPIVAQVLNDYLKLPAFY